MRAKFSLRLRLWLRLVLLLLPLILVAPAMGEGASYFSISTTKTFLPGEKVGVHLYASNVKGLEFRMYKVNDPVAFLERVESVHDFGHIMPKEQIDKPTLIERFHDWKRRQWIDLRNFFRAQFSAHSRATIRQSEASAQSRALTGTTFAQVPLINRSQLVARWHQDLSRPLFNSESGIVPVDSLPKGVYLVEATDGSLRAYTIVLVSELGLITKSSPGEILAFAADRTTGAPVAGADVRVWLDKKEAAKLQSNADGLARTAIAENQYQDARIIAVHGDDVALVAPYAYSLSSNPAEDRTGYIYTDRPVYRPTHTVYFKVILRSRDGEDYKIPAGESVQVLIEDPDSKPVLRATFPVSSFGTVHGDLELPAAAALGYYSITVNGSTGARYQIAGGFYVEEYKKPEYEVKVTPVTLRVLQGAAIDATIDARYYFGEPVAGAKVTYVVHTSPYYSPFMERDDEDGENVSQGAGSESDDESDYAGDQISEQSGKLDANGRLTVHIPTGIDAHHQDIRYRIEARVTDDANREISGHNNAVATYGSFQVGISAESYVYQNGETIHATAVARDYDGKAVSAMFHVELLEPRYYTREAPDAVLESKDIQSGADGTAAVTFSAGRIGGLRLRVSAITPENRQVQGNGWLYVTGSAASAWGGESRDIRIVPDKKSYAVGDTAHVLMLTAVPDAYLLVTTEARTIQNRQVVHASGSSVTVDIPITREQQPNVFVSATFFRDNQLYQSNHNLKVPAVQQKLQIDIQPSQKQFLPGQKAAYLLSVHDSAGKPVSTELSIGVVDEAIYAIHPDSSGDISDAFYGPAYDRVSTDSSLSFYFSGESGNRQMFLSYYRPASPRALAQLKPTDTLVQPKVRKVFPDTALWLADVHTDSSGRATAPLTFPDSLTTWRATVRGVTTDTKVGAATNTVIVRKNVVVRLAAPRFFRQGDEVTLSAIVHNYLPSEKTVQVSLDVTGLEVLAGATGTVQVPSKGEAKLDWRVRAKSIHEAMLTAKALTNEESDALEITLPILPVGVKRTDAKSGSLVAANEDTETVITLPGNPDEAIPALDITLSSSVAGSVFSALDYLTSYPYGCTEQTMSSFLPNIVVAKAMQDLHLQTPIDTPELNKKITAGMDRLKDFQHDDGGWGWWKDDESQVFMTAYVVSGLAQAHSAGYDVDADRWSRADDWLHSILREHPNMRPDLRAYVVYALALSHVASADDLQSAWDHRSEMNAQGLAMTGLALQAGGDSEKAQQIAKNIEALAVVSDREAYWKADYDYFMEFYIDDQAETTAYALRLLSLVKPGSPLLPKAAFWLVNARNGGYYWDSTKQTAMVIFGLTEYLKASHELGANFHAGVTVNGRSVMSRQFVAADALNPLQPSIHLDASQLSAGANTIHIHKSGDGRLYWSASGSYYSKDKRFVQSNKLSLNITRDYFRMAPEQAKGKIVYDLTPLQGAVHVGDILAVRVTVGGSEWRYLLIEDPIPAGAEFITKDNLYELKEAPSWWEWTFDRREFHDDRAAIFKTYFNGREQDVYLLKIVNPGKFQISPAMVTPMYQPSIQATSDAAVLEVQ